VSARETPRQLRTLRSAKTSFSSQTSWRSASEEGSRSLSRRVYRPQPRVDRDSYDRTVRVAVDTQPVLSRPVNFKFVAGDWGQQSRLAYRQIIAGGGVPSQFDFERISLVSYFRDGV
jgi:hypothetical protein